MSPEPSADRIHSVEVCNGWTFPEGTRWRVFSVRYRVPGQKKLEKMSFRGETWELAARAFGMALDRDWPNVELSPTPGPPMSNHQK